MKELTIKEKAKAYDRAIKRAKELLEHGLKNSRDKRVVLSFFPELKESEDERIKRNIIAALKGEGYYDCDLTNECIAWVEKQGYTKKDVDDAYLKGICDAKHELEKQGEQPRYSIGDVLCDKSCTTLNKDTQPNFEIVDIKDGMYICDNGSFPISQQDEYELVAKKIEQKSQRMVSAEAKEALYDKPTDKEMKELLRTEYEKGRADTLSEMKSSWSKDDEQYLLVCKNALAKYQITDKWDASIISRWLDNKLKSAKHQSQVEPSEEQIKTCKEVYADILSAKGFDLGTVNNELNRLEEQLKKLTE